MTKPQAQLIREGIEQLREIENDRQAGAIEALLNSSLSREPDETARLAPRDGDLDLIYGAAYRPEQIRHHADWARAAGSEKTADLIRGLDRRNVALLHECERLGNLVSVNLEQMQQGENALLRRQLDALRQALRVSEEQTAQDRQQARDQIEDLQTKLARAKQRSNEAHGAWAAAETRLVDQVRRAQALDREIEQLRSTWTPPQDGTQ